MINNPESFSSIQFASQQLKEGFKSTESRPWELSNFGAELMFQTTHLLHAVSETTDTSYSLPGINKGVEDEAADVLFNIMNFANFYHINVLDILQLIPEEEYSYLFSDDIDIDYLAKQLTILAGELWDATFRQDKFKHEVRSLEENELNIKQTLALSLTTLQAIANKLGINLIHAFTDMHKDASYFLQTYHKDGSDEQ